MIDCWGTQFSDAWTRCCVICFNARLWTVLCLWHALKSIASGSYTFNSKHVHSCRRFGVFSAQGNHCSWEGKAQTPQAKQDNVWYSSGRWVAESFRGPVYMFHGLHGTILTWWNQRLPNSSISNECKWRGNSAIHHSIVSRDIWWEDQSSSDEQVGVHPCILHNSCSKHIDRQVVFVVIILKWMVQGTSMVTNCTERVLCTLQCTNNCKTSSEVEGLCTSDGQSRIRKMLTLCEL